jgi:uncharacterized protein YkwD
MQRTITAVAALAALVLLSGCLSANQTKMIDLVNNSRRSARIGSVSGDAPTAAKAQAWADHMARTGVVEHTGGGSRIDTSGIPKWCSVGENVGMASSIADLHAAWMRSSAHKSNILSTTFNRIGTGVVRKGNVVYGVQIFYRAC